jgi:chaperonin GroEL
MLLKFKSALNSSELFLRNDLLKGNKISSLKNFCYIWNKMKKIKGEDPKKIQKNKYDYVDLKFGNEARSIITNSILEVSSTVGKTFGPLGKNVAISESDNPIIVTKDGVTVAKYIKFSSRKKNLGCRLMGSIAGSTNTYAGDGTTTSTVLAAEIVKWLIKFNFRKGNSLIDIGFHPIEVKKGIEFAAKKMIEYLEEIKIKIKTHKDLFDLAMITTNQNVEISEIVSEALSKVGLKGLITLEESQTGNTQLKVYRIVSILYLDWGRNVFKLWNS